MKDPYAVIKYPLATEKCIGLISQNALVFIVDMKARKSEIREALSKLYNIKIKKIQTMLTPQGKKKAIVKLDESTPAADVATTLGLL